MGTMGLTTKGNEGTSGDDRSVLYHDHGRYMTVYICQSSSKCILKID